ncbi:MAG: metal ABC transporter ATP-binding protein [Lachnospiraceae bacterium]|nr:metal ABC transporter ATP-binding protein [Lachnospiraceae bacterium]
MAYITCKDLSLGYDGQVISEKINFDVKKGDYLCIVGENGAGKSTLMKTLLHLIEPISGSIEYGDDISLTQIGYLPQQTQIQKDFPASVKEIVLSGTISAGTFKPFYSSSDKEKALKNMERMDILDLKNKSYRSLSGGQQQRVLLARALCATEKMLILDEPVTGLDPKVTAEFYRLIKQLNKEGLTVIMVSHDLQAAINYATHILHVGKIQQFFGPTEDYLESCAFRKFSGFGGEE